MNVSFHCENSALPFHFIPSKPLKQDIEFLHANSHEGKKRFYLHWLDKSSHVICLQLPTGVVSHQMLQSSPLQVSRVFTVTFISRMHLMQWVFEERHGVRVLSDHIRGSSPCCMLVSLGIIQRTRTILIAYCNFCFCKIYRIRIIRYRSRPFITQNPH